MAIVSHVLGLIFFWFLIARTNREDYLDCFPEKNIYDNSGLWAFVALLFYPFSFVKKFDADNSYRYVILAVIIFLLLTNYLNFYFSMSKVNFSALNEAYTSDFGTLFKQISAVNILLSQVGGLFFQSLLVFFFGTAMDTDITFKEYIKCVALSYVGFLLSGIILFLYNFITLSYFNSLVEFSASMTTSFFRVVFGKLGEFWSLTILSLLIFKCGKGRINIYWSIFNAFLPSILILVSSVIFNSIF